jgi:chorismate mutase
MVMNPALELRALRGATTASANTSEAITEAWCGIMPWKVPACCR